MSVGRDESMKQKNPQGEIDMKAIRMFALAADLRCARCGGELEPGVVNKHGGHVQLSLHGLRCNDCHTWIFTEQELLRSIEMAVNDAEKIFYTESR